MKLSQKLRIALKKALSLQFGKIATDKAELVFDGEEIAVDVEVFVEDENGELAPAADGEYLAEDGRTIVVAEGKVTEIREKEEEPAVEAEDVEEPASEPADSNEGAEEAANLEDRVAALEDIVAGYTDAFDKIINAIAALEDRLEAVENKIKSLEDEPAAEPAEEPAAEEEEHKSRISYLRKN